MTPPELFKQGKLDEAVEAALQDVRNAPTNVNARSTLCELLCFAGDLERADKQLDAMAQVDPDAMVGISMFRHLLRAEVSRREFYVEGRVPEFATDPTDEIRHRLAAHVAVREGRVSEAVSELEKADQLRTPLSGECNGQAFDDFRDLDDMLGSVLEVLTSNGKYYWIPFDALSSVSFDEIEYTRDLLWRPVEIEVEGEIEGRVYAPAIYFGSHEHEDQKARVGQATDWDESDGIVRGIGQRMMLVGEEAGAFLEIKTLRFNR